MACHTGARAVPRGRREAISEKIEFLTFVPIPRSVLWNGHAAIETCAHDL